MRYIPPESAEEKLFVSRISDTVRLTKARHCARFSSFLNLREKSLAEAVTAHEKGLNCVFFGGAEDCERVMLGVSEDEISEWEFPLTQVDYDSFEELSHRDILGAVLGLGITREKVGDILVSGKSFRIFLSDDIAGYVTSNLESCGRSSVSVTEHTDIDFSRRFEEKTDTVASPRLDRVVAAMTKCSGGDAAALIEHGQVAVNHLTTAKVSFEVEDGDVISVRGSGRFCVDSISDLSRRGRTILRYRRYI